MPPIKRIPPEDTPPEVAQEPSSADSAPPADPNEERFARLEALLERDREANARLVAELQERLAAALARPEKLKSPGQFVGRPGAPDSPIEDHYTLVLMDGTLVDTVHPTATHMHSADHPDRLVPVIGVYHSPQVEAAQRPAD